jgi:hypothetical protein
MKKKISSKNNIPKFSTGGQTLTGVATGAGVGASIGSIIPGPGTAIGAGVGAVIGGVGGYLKGQSEQDAIDADKKAFNSQQAKVAFNQNYKPQFASGYYTMANGGIMPGTNAMVDNNEVVQTNGPINQLAQSNGGGQLEQTSANTAVVNGNNPNQTDGVQAQIEPGSRIFSDKIKAANGKTYAELADRISKGKSRYEKLLEQNDSSQLQKKTAEKMIEKIDEELDRLFQEQEATKFKSIEQSQPIQQGEPMMASGGIVPRYSGLGDYPDIIAPYKQPNMMQTNPIGQLPQWNGWINGPMPYDEKKLDEIDANNNISRIQSKSIDQGVVSPTEQYQTISPVLINNNGILSGIKPGPTATNPNDPNDYTRPGYKRDQYGNEYKVNALGLSNYQTSQGILKGIGMLGPAVNIGRGLFEKVDLLDPNAYNNNARITAPKMDVEPQVAEVRNAAIANRRNLGSMGAQSFLTGMNSINSASDRSIAGIYSNKHNIDAENQMKADIYNAEANKSDTENRLRIEMINRAAKGAKDQMLTTGLGQLSDVGYGLAKEDAYNRSMQGVNSNYYLAPDGTWKVRYSSEKGNVGTEKEKSNRYNSPYSSLLSKTSTGLNDNFSGKNRPTENPNISYKSITSSIKAKDNEIFGGKKGVWAKHINGNEEYNAYIDQKLTKAGIPSNDKRRATMTWGQIKKYLD